MKIAISLLVVLLSSCAGLPTTPAPWDAAPAAIRQVFPDNEYIAQRGRGATRAAAEADGAAQIARFFNTQISSQLSVIERYSEQNGDVQSNTDIETETFIQSQMNMFGIRYASDAYYRRDMREWQTVAWIERAEAWAVYGPGFRRLADSFTALFNAAEDERDPFKKALRFMAAENFARAGTFESASLFGQILDPRRMNAEFGTVRAGAAAIPQKLDEAKRSAGIYIDCPGDFESLVSNAFASRFSALGFPVAGTRNAAAAVCHITVDEGMQQREVGIFYYPSLQAEVSGPSGTLFSFSAEGERAAAVTPDVAKRRAYQSLADKVNQTFSLDTNGS